VATLIDVVVGFAEKDIEIRVTILDVDRVQVVGPVRAATASRDRHIGARRPRTT
jgi:hypothetical protein